MKDFLNKVRESKKDDNLKKKIIITILIFVIGIILGIFSKYIDNLESTNSIIDKLDLRNILSGISIWFLIALSISVFSKNPIRAAINVFVFFIGMTVSYHLYTIIFSGFNPKNYMMIWYTLTILSPLLAFICFYARSNHWLSIIIASFIIGIMITTCFSIGMWYFDIKSIIETLIFIGTIIILYVKPKNSIISLIGGLIIAFIMRMIY